MKTNSPRCLVLTATLIASLAACDPNLTDPLEETMGRPEPGEILWSEGWEHAGSGSYVPSGCDVASDCTFIRADAGSWYVGDTVSSSDDCGPTPHRAEITAEEGNKELTLLANDSDSGCVDNIWIDLIDPEPSIPLNPNTHISFYEIGELVNAVPDLDESYPCGLPPCGDKTYLSIADAQGRLLVYVLQRSAYDLPFPAGVSDLAASLYRSAYREIFLDPAQGYHERNLFADFSGIDGFQGSGAKIAHVAFQIQLTGFYAADPQCDLWDYLSDPLACRLSKSGWATIDDITITECQPIEPTGACCLGDRSCMEMSEACCSAAEGVYEGDDTTCHEDACKSIVIALGGEGQEPNPSNPDWNTFGVYHIAQELQAEGYSILMYDEDAVGAYGAGRAYDDVVDAIQNDQVTMVAIIGYSHGGGSTYDLADRLHRNGEAIGAFAISCTAYIDAIFQYHGLSEARLHPGTQFHVNYYQRHGPLLPIILMGDEVPGAHNVNITDPNSDGDTSDGWLDATGQPLDHFNIDDDIRVRQGIISVLVSQLGSPSG